MDEKFLIGKVQSVDTGNVSVEVDKEELLNNVQIHQIVQIRSTKTGEKIIGLISKIIRKAVADKIDESSDPGFIIENLIKINLVGTLIEKVGLDENVFKRTLNTVPSINADCFLLQGNDLSTFMNTISSNSENPLKIGKYTISEESVANLDGNKFFQRHAVIVGGTGSGKSWTVASILEKATKLKSINSVVFDLHGEYKPLSKLDNTTLLKIAGPSDKPTDENVMFLPYWLLSYEEIESMLLDRSDSNAPNQSRTLFDLIIKYKKEKLEKEKQQEVLNNFTVESPIPYNIANVLSELDAKDSEMVPGAKEGTKKQGSLNGKLTRFIQRLKSKQSDKRLNFIFNSEAKLLEYDWFVSFVKNLLDFGNNKGLKIIDFSEVPSDILPLITGLIGRLIFSIQQWMEVEKRHPIALFCDEAHLYIPANLKGGMEEKGLQSFERIAKEGRKYGISLVVISQRPSDVSKTILSQCGNFVAMRLTNPEDQNVIKRLFPDNLGGFSDMLPILDIGEALIVGDASLLPSRVIIDKPTIPPDSATIDFWDEWGKEKTGSGIEQAVASLRKQQK
ncbi:ATP-binding protein [Bathymodiolus thermophilus thioautotrophic gill symbiont]|uniref:ATPase n=1 Tax=Bathymodiolus thermophilus thioautotrophic gill symbiont TaxID=2360 RepID=A0A1J5U8W1_9GAMM|nr:ATP-binding protein [Bathymodiolus thermophilus thioautotrophic gill symbiont]OIR25286.1 ATPase [Bathymodiolus thermophilus thioautotrophic gill symbiont]